MNAPEKFTKREVERSFRKFNDLVNDVMISSYQTWGDAMTRLAKHCESDPVMQVVTSPLKSHPRVDARKWWNGAIASTSSFVGSGRYTLPDDDEERTSLLYQVILLLEDESEKVSFSDFCVSVYGHTKYQDMVNAFNREIVSKFTREVSYRLDEVSEDIAGQAEIPRESIVVFHHHDYSTTITGNIQGSNVATGGAQLSNSNATFNSSSDVAAELRALKSIAAEFSKANQKTIESALEFLASRAEVGDGDPNEIAENARAVIELSPTIGSRLKGLVAKVGTSVASSAIIEGLKLALGF